MKLRPHETDGPPADPDIDQNGVDRAQIFIESMIEIRELNEECPVR